ncbi:FkbM family methyltransferase [Legionella longbeachae]|uniref:Methyltransferase FkbM domain-containing protein n=1 Tax=Legionella longbeachae serogroup 1 (strain NSW150) TaxID=661367 RepID=D3HQF4_LEGLN|nr:FkbM family methyltransferase [Legionella longbeachae]VEE01640.1 methoxymalonyl CoA synthase [Legionella oakridgensis]HBD7396400.1 FkbM family methyltransferase [Legionella pneumophila]ARB92020.1 FkbM family methyltransferase [Legionella longbeachae]ARM34795.1 FkbM family methyltransferase [Legionella longbeachae]EEZ95767.1 FkbM family methyltransferase [Legionella longbeachae D-4968]
MFPKIVQKKFGIGDLYFVNELETHGLIYEIFSQKTYLLDFLSLNPGAIIVDVGANIGIFSLFALQHCNYTAEIHCFEPIPMTFFCLQKNLEHFKGRIHLYNTGISNVAQDCEVAFTLFGKSAGTATYKPQDKLISNFQPLLDYNTLLKLLPWQNKFLYYQLKWLPFFRDYFIKKNYTKQTQTTQVTCKLTSLGRFIEQNQIKHIDFLKVDVEGAEIDVIKSIQPKQFSIIKQISIEVHNIENRVEKLNSYLQKQGYITLIDRNPILADLGFNHHMIYAKRIEHHPLDSRPGVQPK